MCFMNSSSVLCPCHSVSIYAENNHSSLNRQPAPAAATKFLFASTCYDFYSVVLVLHSDTLSTMIMLPRSMKTYLTYIVLQSFKMMLSAADPVFYLIDTSIIWLVQDTSHINALSLYMLQHNATRSHIISYTLHRLLDYS